ncbi:hypothetical protein CRM22_000573 [Opisthorchis felineus]|uniref:Peptidase M60 domain-containing protein n=1 Tax=Opisthorchis felineus TaxID=147828 RepID=A0A4S2MEE4_OPIFE|nr:hypothetical protein CRM22_000573 [Opisthorchis felineus]
MHVLFGESGLRVYLGYLKYPFHLRDANIYRSHEVRPTQLALKWVMQRSSTGLHKVWIVRPNIAPNVALQKTVIGSGRWRHCAVDGNFRTTFAPYAVQFPFYYVDLGALYNLTSINLFCQNEGTFRNLGVNVPFDVHTFGQWMSECNYQSYYPWDLLASGIEFKKKGEEVVLIPNKPVQYIIIGQPNTNYPISVRPIQIGEIQAHGEKLRDTQVPQVPTGNEPLPENFHKETRKAVLGKQEKIWMEPGRGYFKPNDKYGDVVLGWADQPNSMAIVRKQARMVLVMGHELIREIDSNPLYGGLRASCKEWLTNGSSMGEYVGVNENYRPGDVLLITRDDQFDVDQIYCKLLSGSNSALIGYPRRDTDDSLSQLLKKMKITFIETTEELPPQFISVKDSADSDAFIPTSYWLERYVKSWKAFSTQHFQARSEELGIEQQYVEDRVKKLTEKYGSLMEYLGPCDTKNYVKNEETATALLNYNLALKYQYGSGTGIALPIIHKHPGTIPPSTKPISVIATVYADLAGSFFPLGVYAKPGEGFRWAVLENSDETFSNQWIRINAQTDLIGHYSKWSRWPSVSTELYIRKQGQYISPHGGPLFLQLPRGVNITIQLENVYRYPWLDLRNPKSVASFEQEIKVYSTVPWLVISGDSMNSMLRTIDVYNSEASEVISSARHFDNAIKVMHNYRGSLWEEARSEMFVADIQISARYGHPGYPWMGILSWSRLFTLWSSSIKKGGQPGFVNTIGKNLQVVEATLKRGDEVTNVVYQLLVEDVLLGLNPYQGDMDTGKWSSSKYNGPGLGYYRYLGKLFGYGLVGNGFMEARKNSPLNESDKTNFWVRQTCMETGYNLVPFHKMWNFPISDETQKSCRPLPCFFPDDEYTKKYKSKVDDVLKEFKGNCSRSDPNKVVFRGDIKRGVDTVRPQNIFLTFE